MSNGKPHLDRGRPGRDSNPKYPELKKEDLPLSRRRDKRQHADTYLIVRWWVQMVSVRMQLAGYGMVNRIQVHLITTRLVPNITPATTAQPTLKPSPLCKEQNWTGCIWGSHGEYGEHYLLRCDAVWPGRCLPTSRRSLYDATVARLYSLEWYGGELEGIRKETILA